MSSTSTTTVQLGTDVRPSGELSTHHAHFDRIGGQLVAVCPCGWAAVNGGVHVLRRAMHNHVASWGGSYDSVTMPE